MPDAPAPDAIIAEILSQVHARTPKTVCPSEIARALASDQGAWRPLMPQVRAQAAVLAAAGRLRVTQKGRVVDALAARGPIRLSAP
ncbi:MAG: DUF3253 domain-containing protein [Pseudomonadota bacterium]